MTRRYTSGFDILGLDTDPTPGDPDTILNQVVPVYQSIGDNSQAAVSTRKAVPSRAARVRRWKPCRS